MEKALKSEAGEPGLLKLASEFSLSRGPVNGEGGTRAGTWRLEIERKDAVSTSGFRDKLRAKLGRLQPTVWEPSYITFTAGQHDAIIGYAVVVDELGKHDPITLVVSTGPDFKVRDVAVMVCIGEAFVRLSVRDVVDEFVKVH